MKKDFESLMSTIKAPFLCFHAPGQIWNRAEPFACLYGVVQFSGLFFEYIYTCVPDEFKTDLEIVSIARPDRVRTANLSS